MEDKKMKFHITITDNETGETLKDCDACCIIGACNEGEHTAVLAALHCTATDLANAIDGTEEAVAHVKRENPEVEMLMKLKHLFDGLETHDEADEETEDQ